MLVLTPLHLHACPARLASLLPPPLHCKGAFSLRRLNSYVVVRASKLHRHANASCPHVMLWHKDANHKQSGYGSSQNKLLQHRPHGQSAQRDLCPLFISRSGHGVVIMANRLAVNWPKKKAGVACSGVHCHLGLPRCAAECRRGSCAAAARHRLGRRVRQAASRRR